MEKTTLQKAESFVCGNFNVKLELDESLAELAEKVRVVLLNGATQILQRKPASEWEKKSAGYSKRPTTGFSRDDIKFSAEFAESMENIFNDAVEGIALTSVEEYVPNVKEAKFTEEKDIVKSKGGDEYRLQALADAVGFDGDELVTDNLAFLGKIREYLKAERAKTLETIGTL